MNVKTMFSFCETLNLGFNLNFITNLFEVNISKDFSFFWRFKDAHSIYWICWKLKVLQRVLESSTSNIISCLSLTAISHFVFFLFLFFQWQFNIEEMWLLVLINVIKNKNKLEIYLLINIICQMKLMERSREWKRQ